MSEESGVPSNKYSVRASLAELYEYRNVLRSMVEKSLFGRYKNTYLGFAWHFAMPVVYIVLCYFIYTGIRGREFDYLIFVASGIFAFHMLTSSVAGGCGCFTGSAGILKKMYIPKQLLVYARVITHAIVMAVGCLIILFVILVSGWGVNLVALLFLPPVIVLMCIFCAGCMLILSSLTVYVRDLHPLLGSMGIAFFVFSPIRNSVTEMEGIRATVMWANPFTYYLEAFHSIFYSKEIPDPFILVMCALLAFVFFAAGMLVFNRLKHGFVERL